MATSTRSETHAPARSISLRGYLIVLASTAIMSTTGILIKFLLVDFKMEALALAFLRVLIVSGGLGVVLFAVKPALFRIQPRHLLPIALFGIFGVGMHQLVWVTSVQLNGAAVSTVLVYLQPAIVALVSVRFLQERLDRTKIAALLLSLSGMVLVAKAYDVSNLQINGLGILVGLGSGVTWACYALLGRYITRRYSAWTSLFYAFLFGTLFLLPMQLLVHNTLSLGAEWSGWALLFFLSLGPTLGGFALYTIGLSQVPASVVTLIATLEPVFTIVLAYFLFGEVLNVAQLFGAGLILASVVLLRPR